ncbi:MAG: GlxA family transcriptional regulator, partial [Bradyrhizobium sp.]
MNALVLASEALRIANQNSGRELFRWRFVSEDGKPVRASNGLWMSADDSLQTMPPADFYLVFEGNLPTQRNSPKLLNQLRTAARFGATIGAVDTGTFA